jgi:hypothetical protein
MSRYGLEYEPPTSPPEDSRWEAAYEEAERRWLDCWKPYDEKRVSLGEVVDCLIADGFSGKLLAKLLEDGYDELIEKLTNDLYDGRKE